MVGLKMTRHSVSITSVRVAFACVCLSLIMVHVNCMSIDKEMLNATTKMDMFDLFHVMPSGEVMVLTELDQMLTLDQYKLMYTNETGREKRKALRDPRTRWTNCYVYYEITEGVFSDGEVQVIKSAMEEWEKYTCLVFKEEPQRDNRIQFVNGTGCSSAVGMQRRPQSLTLAPGGCRTKGVVLHEIGHAIGFLHEHVRPDRDQYVRINKDNIISVANYMTNFVKLSSTVVNDYGVPYDYTSIMHYGQSFFASQRDLLTIETLDPAFQGIIGQQRYLSFKDIKLANLMYDCPTIMRCPDPDRICEHNGFVFYGSLKGSSPCECWCDSGNLEDPLVLCSSIDREVAGPNLSPLPESPVVEVCYDLRENCKEMKAEGLCKNDYVLMMKICAKTCDFCGKGENLCMDHERGCDLMAASGLCTEPGIKMIMASLCPASCGLCTEPSDACAIQNELFTSSGVKITLHAWGWACIVVIILKYF